MKFKFLGLSLALSIIFVIGNVTIVAQDEPDMVIDKSVRDEVVKTLAKDLEEAYVFPDVGAKIAAKLRSENYSGLTSARAFAEKLTKDIQSFNNDRHLRVRFMEQKIAPRENRREPTKAEIEQRLDFMRRINYGFDSVKRLSGNVGYIELRGFLTPNVGEETVAAAMNFVANTDALIIDLRRNGGGDPAMVAMICSYFFGDEKVHLNDLYWRQGDRTTEFWTNPKVLGKKYLNKPIYVLTSNRTFSGAEEFSYNLQTQKRGMIIGETTGGGAHPGGYFRLHDHFRAFIATGRAINPITKTNWEGTGVKPDVEVNKDIALEVAKKKALKGILQNTKDPRTERAIKREIESLSKKIGEFEKEKSTAVAQ